jgi:uncharacterized protein YjbI with pentapeptide repeats
MIISHPSSARPDLVALLSATERPTCFEQGVFDGADLSGLDFSGIRFVSCSFAHAQLDRATLTAPAGILARRGSRSSGWPT